MRSGPRRSPRHESRGAITMTVVSDPPSATVVLDGEIDIATAPAIRRFLMAAINGGDVHLAVDMSGVTFIDASGIGVLVAAANRARQAGGACRCWRRPGRCGGCWTSCTWTRSCRQPSAQVAPSLPTAPPDAPRACRNDEARCGFQAPASRSRSCFVPGPAPAASHGAGIPFGEGAFTVKGGHGWFLLQAACSARCPPRYAPRTCK
jgi:anti-anti-sigma factor